MISFNFQLMGQDHQRKRWPRLSSMAIDILSIPAMGDQPERVFFWGTPNSLVGNGTNGRRDS